MRRRIATAILLIALGPVPATARERDDAQEVATQQVPRPANIRPQRLGIRAYFVYDRNRLMASQTFEGVIGTSELVAKGAGGEVLGLWRGLFARAAFSTMEHDGSRVIVFEDEAVSLGIPLTVKMSPLEIAGGWRFASRTLSPRIGPYAGGGLLRLTYVESSDFAGANEDVSTVFNGYLVFGGVDVTIVPWVVAGVEVQYRTVSDAIGKGGASQVYGETNLGGTTVRLLIGIKR